jgi:peptidyl-tRNA hydrolase, PTH1 family
MELELEKIKLIVGLGNPGPKFSNTRHNLGAVVAEKIKPNQTTPRKIFIPDTFMNESGLAVAKVARKNGLAPELILVIHDDIDLEPGQWKYKTGGGAGGHNGVRSIIVALGADTFPRIRVGVGRPFPHKPTSPAEEEIIARYVLEKIPPEDLEKINTAMAEIIEIF